MNEVQAARKAVPKKIAQKAIIPPDIVAKKPRRAASTGSGFLAAGAGFCGMTGAAAAGLAVAAAVAAAAGALDRSAFAGRLEHFLDGGPISGRFCRRRGCFGRSGLCRNRLFARRRRGALLRSARAAARMSFVDFAAAAAGAAPPDLSSSRGENVLRRLRGPSGRSCRRFGSRSRRGFPSRLGRAAARMSFVDLGAAAGFGSAGGAAFASAAGGSDG